jgi:ERCC4-type nuclease
VHVQSIRKIANASPDELAVCPGLGAVKVRHLHDVFHQPLVMQSEDLAASAGSAAAE